MRHRADLAMRHAERVVREKGLTALPVDPKALAAACGIEVMTKPASSKGVSGMLIKVPDSNSFVIGYATHIDNEGFQRFSIAHELGHFFLDGHCDHLFGGDSLMHASHAGFVSEDPFELEADHFAAGLLMPRQLFVPAMERAGSGFVAIRALAERCKTSLTATAIRYAELSGDEPVAVVMSAGQRILYWFASAPFKRIPGITWLRRGDLLPRDSWTAAFNKDEGRVERCERWERTSSIHDWFGEGPNRELAEDVVGLGSYSRTLTVLFAEDPADWPDDEDEAEEDDPSAWDPTFHRSRRR